MTEATSITTEATPAAGPSRTAAGGRVYYGWVIVAVAAAGMVATLPGRTHGLGMVTERILADPALDVSRTTYGHINLWATLVGALFCLGCGPLIDRWGARVTLTAVLVALGAATIAMSQAGSLAALFAGVTLTRGFGQSALSVVSLAMVGKWFDRRLSWAMAVYSVLMAAGFIAAFRTAALYAETPWRSEWAAIGGCVLAFAPLAWLLTRDSPESCGLRVERRAGDVAAPSETSGFTLREALRTPAFWAFGLGTSVYGLIVSGISLFNESILAERGFDKQVYYDALAIGTGVGLASNLASGWLAQRISIARLTGAALALHAATLVWLTRVTTYGQVVAYVCASAAAGGVITVVFFTVWGRLYGRPWLGRIQGAAQMLTVLASAVGPLLFAETHARFRSYHPVLLALAAGAAALGMLTWFVPLPRRAASSVGDAAKVVVEV